MAPTIGQIFCSELIGTALLILLGCGVVASVVLRESKASGGSFLAVNIGWAMAVFVGASVASTSGSHLNPAITLAAAITGHIAWPELPVYVGAQFIGAFVGAVLCWLTFKPNFDAEPNPEGTLGIFATGPAVRAYGWNTVTEAVATFVLVLWVLRSPGLQGGDPDAPLSLSFGNAGLGYAAVAFVVLGIGASLGGPTGYAINPARDLGPRLAYAVLPIRGKGKADWAYSWVPIVGPLIGGSLAGLLDLAMQGWA